MNKSLITGFATALVLVFVVLFIPHIVSSTSLTASVANSTVSVAPGLACARTAVNARENAIITANAAFEQTINAAYKARAASLNTAYSQTSWSSVSVPSQTAFAAFNTSINQAYQTLATANNSAAANYNAAIKACEKQSPTMPVQPVIQTSSAASTATSK